MAKEKNEDFRNYIKCWICDNDYINEVQHIGIEIIMLNKSQISCRISQPKKL